VKVSWDYYSQIYGNIKKIFQTTNQQVVYIYTYENHEMFDVGLVVIKWGFNVGLLVINW